MRDVLETITHRLGTTLDAATTTVEERPGQDAAYVIDSTRARTELGWRPTIEFDAGIDEVVRWVEEYWSEIVQRPLEYEHRA